VVRDDDPLRRARRRRTRCPSLSVGESPGLDGNCGAGNWAITPAGLRGVVNDAIAFYFVDPALANAFIARWCIGYRVETVDGSFRLREGDLQRAPGAPLHKTP
jgi:hypothetical protein